MNDCEPNRISRREALRWVLAATASTALIGPSALGVTAAQPYGRDPLLTTTYAPGDLWPLTLKRAQRGTLIALVDLIIPGDEKSPSASVLGVPDFIDEWISAPYEVQRAQRKTILEGLEWLDAESRRRFNAEFANLTAEQQARIADDICLTKSARPEFRQAAEFFDLARSLTATGFYTTPNGWKDVGFIGNVALAAFPDPPADVLEKLGLTDDESLKHE